MSVRNLDLSIYLSMYACTCDRRLKNGVGAEGGLGVEQLTEETKTDRPDPREIEGMEEGGGRTRRRTNCS